jgi:hypothetical protein
VARLPTPLRLCELMPGRRAAVLTGACDAIFHVPLLTLATTYQYAGIRWIVAPTVTATPEEVIDAATG